MEAIVYIPVVIPEIHYGLSVSVCLLSSTLSLGAFLLKVGGEKGKALGLRLNCRNFVFKHLSVARTALFLRILHHEMFEF